MLMRETFTAKQIAEARDLNVLSTQGVNRGTRAVPGLSLGLIYYVQVRPRTASTVH